MVAKRTVSRMEPLRATTLMLVGAAVILTPVWLATGVKIAGHGHAILLGLAVAVLSSALPYFLELAAIKRVRASTYGILLSIEPAIAALMGFPHTFTAPGPPRDRGSHSRHRGRCRGASWVSRMRSARTGARQERMMAPMSGSAAGASQSGSRQIVLAVAALAGQSVFLGYNWVVMKIGLRYSDVWPFTAPPHRVWARSLSSCC